jgi:hypothetical protein
MSDILSDAERNAVYRRAAAEHSHGEDRPWPDGHIYGLRAVERAVVEKLAAMGGELPAPAGFVPDRHGTASMYTADQMREMYARGVAAGKYDAGPTLVQAAWAAWDYMDSVGQGNMHQEEWAAAEALRRALAAPSAEPTVPAASVNWLLEQCEEYQRRAHEAEREVLALRAQIEQIGGGR